MSRLQLNSAMDRPDGDNNADAADVFLYTAGAVVPKDVVRVRVDPSVTTIPSNAFTHRMKLEQVELCEGLQEIGGYSFNHCRSLKNINIPSTVTKIGVGAFAYCTQLHEVEFGVRLEVIRPSSFEDCALKHVILPNNLKRIERSAFAHNNMHSITVPESLEHIGKFAFGFNNFPKFRIPPTFTRPACWFTSCTFLFSVELPANSWRHDSGTFCKCRSLRNIAFPPDIELLLDDPATSDPSETVDLSHNMDLRQLFDSEGQIQLALKHRFDELPIHKILYYHSYNSIEGTVENLTSVIDRQSGRERDCLGMTPLHILACSTKQDRILYLTG